MKRTARLATIATVAVVLGCGGGSGGGGRHGGSGNPDVPSDTLCDGACPPRAMSATDVERIIAQAAAEVEANRAAPATVAVVDHVGNVLAVFVTAGGDPAAMTTITSKRTPPVTGGLENVAVPRTLAAISKAGTAAYLSTQGHGLTTRTANQIVQQNFNPGENGQASGPLFGVQFSQLPCGDLVKRFGVDALEGPKRMPLGLAADPGGLPLFLDGVPVGAVGVEIDGKYTVDPDIRDVDVNIEERVATAATRGFETPGNRRADRIAVAGRFLRFADDERVRSKAVTESGLPAGTLVAVPGFFDPHPLLVQPGVLFSTSASGVMATTFDGQPAEILVDTAGDPRYPPAPSIDPAPPIGLTATEVRTLLDEALRVAYRARAQIRRPAGSSARATISVVDTTGVVLGIVRAVDAPPFGIDVSLQKARTAAFLSSPSAALDLAPVASRYVAAVGTFTNGAVTLANGVALADRSIGNLARPFFPDGINGNPNGPFSEPFPEWSPFNTGLQLDLVLDQLVATLVATTPLDPPRCTNVGSTPANPVGKLANGIQIFPGSVPIYRGDTLIGGVGVSGDGVDQDDLIAFLGLHNAGVTLGGAIGNAPPSIRVDNVLNGAVRYVSCPVSPFLDSTENTPCGGK
jgi:uncharacterized protein GlcG (DUF336 family)